MGSIKENAERINSALDSLLLDGTPQSLYQPLREAIHSGGKRLRPQLTMALASAHGGESEAMSAALAIELLHTFTLVHDDIMDRAEVRRGQPAIWSKHGTSTAILVGDMLMVQAYSCLNQLPAAVLPNALAVFNESAVKVCEGQQLDLEFESKDTVSVLEYTKMIELKTAALLAGACKLGVLTGSNDPKAQQAASDFGHNLGLAFQLQDDLLDMFGDSSRTGKAVGGDVARNKKTFMPAWLLEAGSEGATKLKELMAEPFSNEKVRSLQDLFEETGARAGAEEIRDKYFSSAIAALRQQTPKGEIRSELEAYCVALLNRDH